MKVCQYIENYIPEKPEGQIMTIISKFKNKWQNVFIKDFVI